jgi:hypothetical protein
MSDVGNPKLRIVLRTFFETNTDAPKIDLFKDFEER